MPRPRKVETNHQNTDIKLVLFAASLAGVIAQGKPMSQEQAARAAMEYTEEEVRLIINGAIAEEREACAVIAFNAKTYIEAAEAIRARGQHE